MLKDKQSTLDHSHSYNVCNKLRIRYGSPKKLYLPLSLQMEKCCSRLEWIGANFVMFACVEFNKTRGSFVGGSTNRNLENAGERYS